MKYQWNYKRRQGVTDDHHHQGYRSTSYSAVFNNCKTWDLRSVMCDLCKEHLWCRADGRQYDEHSQPKTCRCCEIKIRQKIAPEEEQKSEVWKDEGENPTKKVSTMWEKDCGATSKTDIKSHRGCFSNWPSSFSVPKGKTALSKVTLSEGAVSLVCCNLFSFFGLKIWMASITF